MRFCETSGISIHRSPVRRHVMQPIGTVAEMNLAVLARYESLGIWQRPIQVSVPPNVYPTAVDLDENGTAIGQRIDIVDSQN